MVSFYILFRLSQIHRDKKLKLFIYFFYPGPKRDPQSAREFILKMYVNKARLITVLER